MAGIFDVVGDVLGTSNTDQINAAKRQLDAIDARAQQVSQANRGIYGNYLNEMKGLYGDGAAQYQSAVERLAGAIGEGPETFTATGSINDFYDPYANQRAQQAMNAINSSASTGGSRFSSSYNDRLAAKQQALSSEEFSNAFDKWMADRNRQMAEWQANQGAKQNYLGNLGTVAGLYGNDRTQLANAVGDYWSNVANQNNADLETYSDITQGKANLMAQKSNGVGDLIGSAGKVAGAIFGKGV